MTDDKSFLGNGWAFPPEFFKTTSETKMVSANDDIRESLYILLSTTPGERIMNPEFGCGLKSLTFNSINESLITILKDMVSKSILFFEPRIKVTGIDIDTTDIDDGVLHININYTIRTTNTRSNMVYPYYFTEGTDIKQ